MNPKKTTATQLLQSIAPILANPVAHGHPDIPPISRFVIDFDGYRGITDLIGGDFYLATAMDCHSLDSDQAEALLATKVLGRTSVCEIFDEIVETHLAHRHPGWNDEEGAHGHLDLRFVPRLRIMGTITRRFHSSRTSKV